MSAILKIELTPGTNIETAFSEAIRLAKTLSCTIEFNFNGITCFGYTEGKVENGVKNYFEVSKPGNQYRIAGSR